MGLSNYLEEEFGIQKLDVWLGNSQSFVRLFDDSFGRDSDSFLVAFSF